VQQTKAKYEIEAEKRELARLLEKKTQEAENLTGKIYYIILYYNIIINTHTSHIFCFSTFG